MPSACPVGDIDILIGTQMVAKGHDFPGVTLVGVLMAELGLRIPDFRASERTFQLMTQIAELQAELIAREERNRKVSLSFRTPPRDQRRGGRGPELPQSRSSELERHMKS